jgi:hypothetical protein
MSLLSIDITKVKRLSLKDVKLPTLERKMVEPITPILEERLPTVEEIAYSKLVAINPLVEKLVDRLDLVSCKTGERIKKLNLRELEERSYDKETLVNWIIREANVSRERAEKGFIYMLEERMIEETIDPDLFYITGSTPF